MKKYTIHYSFYATADVEVLADSEEEAKQKAQQVELELKDYTFDLNEETVSNVENVPDLDSMIEKANLIIKTYDKTKDDCFKVDCYPQITTQLWKGEEYYFKKNLVEYFYWDENHNEYGVIIDGDVEILMSELSEMEQFQISQHIIESASTNGIEL